MRRRPAPQASSMTSFLDVLFLLVFASMIHAAGMEAKRDEPPPAAAASAEPSAAAPAASALDAERLRRAALDLLITGLEGRRAVVARIGRDGRLRALEQQDASGAPVATPTHLPLVEAVPDPDVALSYLGERSPDLRLCNLVRLQLGVPDLAGHLVIIAPDAPLAELSVALARGLLRDADRCLADQRGVAVLLDPRGAEAAP